jgi:class 3 adenylate cyclase
VAHRVGDQRIGLDCDKRKLIAVVHADMVGYSRLISLDDTGTLDRLRKLRKDLIDSIIHEHGGPGCAGRLSRGVMLWH